MDALPVLDPSIARIINPCPGNLQGTMLDLFLLMINSLFASQCTLQHPVVEDCGSTIKDNDKFDFIIVGGGAAGSILAGRLSENPKYTVLVVEAGTDPSINTQVPSLFNNIKGTDEDWNEQMVPQTCACLGFKNQICPISKGKVLGGSSTTNSMIYTRANEKDHDEWSRDGNEEWCFKEALKYYKKSEKNSEFGPNKYHSVDGFLPVGSISQQNPLIDTIFDAAAELGYKKIKDLNADNLLGFGQAQGITGNGERMTPHKAFLVEASKRPNVFILKNAITLKVLINDKTKIAFGIQVYVNNVNLTILAEKEVLLTAGAINNAKILLYSGIGPWKDLQDCGIKVIQNLHVGCNFQDSPQFLGFFVALRPNNTNLETQSNQILDVVDYVVKRSGPLSTIGLYSLRGLITTSKKKYPDIQIRHRFFEKGSLQKDPSYFNSLGLSDDIIKKIIDLNNKDGILSILPKLLYPKSRGYVKLACNNNSINPFDPPKVSADYLERKEDKKKLVLEVSEYIEDFVKTKAMKKLNPEILCLNIMPCSAHKCGSDKYYECLASFLTGPTGGFLGTTKMGPRSDDTSVVDCRLKVHGIRRLRVVDQSVLPVNVAGSTVVVSMMIAENGAEKINADWCSKHRQ